MRQNTNKGFLKALIISSTLLASSAGATTINFTFDGGFTLFSTTGATVVPESGVSGSLSLTVDPLQPQGPYAGSGSISGDQPLFFHYWHADASLTGYQNVAGGGAPAYCGSYAMCADAAISFYYNGIEFPVSASFGMNPSTGIDLSDPTSILNAWASGEAAYFSVKSVDADSDGILGTKITTGPFKGYTPFFEGNAIVSSVCDDLTGVCTTAPSGTTLPTVTFTAPACVPIPAAAWLFGSGLLGLVGFGRRKKC